MRIVVGLGNPGREYALTRHNVGKATVEYMVAQMGLVKQSRARSIARHAHPSGLLCTTECYMNLSGKAVHNLFQELFPQKCIERSQQQLCIVHDDMELPLGTVRLKQGGSHKGHNGLKSILNSFQQQNHFYRLQIGIGRPIGKQNVEQYVLTKWTQTEYQRVKQAQQIAYRVLQENNFI